MADQPANVDVSALSDNELQGIHNQVLQTLATRVRAGGAPVMDYDRHGSGHSRSGGGIVLDKAAAVNPAPEAT